MAINVFEQFIVGIISILNEVISFILLPFDLLINAFLPDLSNAFTVIAEYLQLVLTSIGWVLSATGITSYAITLVIGYYTFKLTLPYSVWLIKLMLRWYRALMP